MIVATIITEVAFLEEQDFINFCNSDECNGVMGFPDELRTAYKFGIPICFATPRPKKGMVTRSTITVKESIVKE